MPATPGVSPYAAARDGDAGAGKVEENKSAGMHCDKKEDEEMENAEDNNKLEDPNETDARNELQEGNGVSEDQKNVTDNLDKVEEETSSRPEEATKASEDLKEVNGDTEELRDSNGGSEEMEDGNSGNLEKLVELFLDKGLLDQLKPIKVESQRRVRAALSIIEKMMSSRVVKRDDCANDIHGKVATQLASIEEEERTAEVSHEGDPAEAVPHVADNVELGQETPDASTGTALEGGKHGSYFPWKEELESLVRGGVPMALRGEVQPQTRFSISHLSGFRVRFNAFMLTYCWFPCRYGKLLWVLVLGKLLGTTTNCLKVPQNQMKRTLLTQCSMNRQVHQEKSHNLRSGKDR